MRHPILRLGDEGLRRPTRPVTVFDASLHALVDDMVETMHAAPGIGLAAPQIGLDLQLCVIDLSVGASHADLIVLANPHFVERRGMQLESEGCLSVPTFYATVARASEVVVRGQDRDGVWRTYDGSGLLARAFQHELDHLRGRLFVDRLQGLQRRLLLGRITRLRAKGRW